jgi:hypothetical protein
MFWHLDRIADTVGLYQSLDPELPGAGRASSGKNALNAMPPTDHEPLHKVARTHEPAKLWQIDKDMKLRQLLIAVTARLELLPKTHHEKELATGYHRARFEQTSDGNAIERATTTSDIWTISNGKL